MSNDNHHQRNRRVLPQAQQATCTPWQPPAISPRGRGLHTLAAELQAKYDEAAAKGYEAGLDQAREQAQAELERQRVAFERVMDLLCQPLANVDPEVEHAVAKLALEVGVQLYQAELQQNPEQISLLVTEALKLVSDAETKLTVHLNEADYELVIETLAHLWESGRVTPRADPGITAGGCVVKGAFSAADATCETRLSAIRDVVLSGLPQLESQPLEDKNDAPRAET